MTEDQFDEWFDTDDGQDAFYAYLYDRFPEMGDDALLDAMQSGDYVEGFMAEMEVGLDD